MELTKVNTAKAAGLFRVRQPLTIAVPGLGVLEAVGGADWPRGFYLHCPALNCKVIADTEREVCEKFLELIPAIWHSRQKRARGRLN